MILATTERGTTVQVTSITLPHSNKPQQPTTELLNKALKYHNDIRFNLVIIVDSMSDLDGKLSIIKHDVKLVENEVLVKEIK